MTKFANTLSLEEFVKTANELGLQLIAGFAEITSGIVDKDGYTYATIIVGKPVASYKATDRTDMFCPTTGVNCNAGCSHAVGDIVDVYMSLTIDSNRPNG